MIHFKICFNKNLIKYICIFVLLFSTIIFSLCLIKNINNKIIIEQKDIRYRSALIDLGEYKNIEIDLKDNEDIIENYDYASDNREILITFVDENSLNNFLNKYEKNFYSVSTESFSNSNYYIVRNIFNVIILISLILIVFLIIIFSVNLIYNLERDVALYKLLGFSNMKILTFLFIFMYLVYTFSYLLSIIIINITFKFIHYFNISIFNDMKFIQLEILEYFVIFLFFSIIILFSFIRVAIKAKKVSPIELIKSY